MPTIDNVAHAGGALCGLLIGLPCAWLTDGIDLEKLPQHPQFFEKWGRADQLASTAVVLLVAVGVWQWRRRAPIEA